MIRFLLRFVGLLLLALGFIFLVYDGIRSISDGGILLTRRATSGTSSTTAAWRRFRPWSKATPAPRSGRSASRRSSISRPRRCACVLGVILIVLGRKKKPLIGYARD